MATKYTVGNPRNIPEGVPISSLRDGTEWGEGQTVTKPTWMSATRVKELLERGVLVKKESDDD